jgi:MFS family permease
MADCTGHAGCARHRLVLSGTERHTFRWHLGFTIFDSAAAAILANAPLMAVKSLAASDWHLNIPLGLSCIGMCAALVLGGAMSNRPKKPFVVVPGLFYAAASLAMASLSNPWLFLLVYGLGSVFEVSSRPAITAIVRFNYQAEHRNHAMGRLRQIAALIFMLATTGSAWLLDRAGARALSVVHLEMIVAGVLSLAACFCFQKIRVREVLAPPAAAGSGPTILDSLKLLKQQRLFRAYLISFAVFAFFNLLYATSVTWAFMSHDLKFSYLGCSLLVSVIPSVASFLFTGSLGAWTDRVGPWVSWALIRLGWGLDPLLMVLAALAPVAAVVPLAVLARLCRGSVMGGSWVLSWQTGVSYFAPRGKDTAQYMGVMTFFNGLMRLAAALVSSLLLVSFSRASVLLIGGSGVLLSAVYALCYARAGWTVQAEPTSAQPGPASLHPLPAKTLA